MNWLTRQGALWRTLKRYTRAYMAVHAVARELDREGHHEIAERIRAALALKTKKPHDN